VFFQGREVIPKWQWRMAGTAQHRQLVDMMRAFVAPIKGSMPLGFQKAA